MRVRNNSTLKSLKNSASKKYNRLTVSEKSFVWDGLELVGSLILGPFVEFGRFVSKRRNKKKGDNNVKTVG